MWRGLALLAMAGGCRDSLAAPGPSDAAAAGAAVSVVGDGDGRALLAAGADWRWSTARAPALVRLTGAVAVSAIDAALGRRGDLAAALGEPVPSAAPADWLRGLGVATGRAPLGASRAGDPCDCATAIGEIGDQRIAALWASARFEVKPGERFTVLELRARYRDGYRLFLNGVEVARRNLTDDGSPRSLATRWHGPEWEHGHLEVTPNTLRVGENTVAVEVIAAAGRLAPFWDLEIVGRRGAALTRGPRLWDLAGDGATIAFDTDVMAPAVVEWGETAALGRRVASPASRHHEVALTGLPPARIHYRVVVAGKSSPLYSFQPPPAAADVVRLAIYGDVREGHGVHGDLVSAIRREAPDAVISTGDLVLRGSDEGDWQRFFAVTRELLAEVPFYPSRGNHDLGQPDQAHSFAEKFSLPEVPAPPRSRVEDGQAASVPPDEGALAPAWSGSRSWYSVDVGGVHVAMLDSNAYGDPAQLAWLDGDLAAARRRGARALFAVTHDGPYARGIHLGNPVAARDYVPLLVKHRVALLFAGHEHMYQRGRAGGLDYILTGGGGASLYPATCGVKGKRRCKVDDGMLHLAREHHYVMVTVYPDSIEACPRRADGSALEACVSYRIASNVGRDRAR